MPLFYEYSGVLCKRISISTLLTWPHGRSEMFRKVLGNLRLKTIVVKILTDKSSNKTYIQKVSALLETLLLSRQSIEHSQCQEESTFIHCSSKRGDPWSVYTEPSYSNENLSFKWELQLSIHCHFCPCCLLYCCHPFLPSLLWVNKMEDQRRPQILKSGVQGGCRALSNRIRNHFWRKIRYFC